MDEFEDFAEVDQDGLNDPFEIRMRKIHHVIHSMSPEILFDEDEHYYFSPLGFVLRMERIQKEISDEIKKRVEVDNGNSRRRTIDRCKSIKEDLMMNRWHPDRVEKMLEAGILEDLW